MVKSEKTPGKLPVRSKLALVLLPLACAVFALAVGRMNIPLSDIFGTFAKLFSVKSGVSEQTEIVIFSMRLPRILLAALVGAGLSCAGCAFQSLFSNPLATPDTLGVASGASFGAVLALLFGFSRIGVQLLSLLGGFSAVLLTFFSGQKAKIGKSTEILAGIMIASLFNSLISLVKFTADTESQLPSITYWLMGSLESAYYDSLLIGAPLIIAGIAALWLLRWRLNLLPLSDDEARSSGCRIGLLRAVTVISATAITASCVSMCGQVGWVGLLVPHICRMKFGSNHLSLIPASVSVGAAFMILTDTAARTISASEIPVSVLTAVVGAPFFLLLMRKTKGFMNA